VRVFNPCVQVIAAALVLCAGCGAADRTSSDSTADTDLTPGAKASGSPATLAEAAQIVDLAKLSLYPAATFSGRRRLASLYYEAPATVQRAFDFHAKQLIERGWRQESGAQITDQYASATFLRDGFKLSLSVFPAGDAGKVNITFSCLGNVDLASLPVPADAKPFFVGPASAIFLSEAAQKKVADACRKLLIDKGWEPYGVAGDSQFFRQNAIRLTAFITVAPAQGGKTLITYSTVLMSAELPAPPFAQNLQYADTTATLSSQTSAKPADVFSFYRQALANAKWEATTTNPVRDGTKAFQIFRNPGKEMLTIETRTTLDSDQSKVTVKYQDATEIAELDRRFKEQQDRNTRTKQGDGK
jgi:hypothetical protein